MHEAVVIKEDDTDNFDKELKSKTCDNAAKTDGAVGVNGNGTKISSRTSAQGTDERKKECDEDNYMDAKLRQSDATIYFDAMDQFPSSSDMSYPPTRRMRQLPVEVDMREAGTFRLLLDPSSRQISTGSLIASGMGESFLSLPSEGIRASVAQISGFLTMENPGTQGTGYPGELTEAELETCLEFREQLKKRDPAFKEMVMAMHPHENEAFALCRFLRARNFDMEDVFTMMQEKNQTENWHAVKRKDPNFFKDFHTAIPEFNGCPLAVFMSQYPIFAAGIGKNGAVVWYFKAGHVSCPGVECIVGNIANALPFAWNRLYHGSRDAMEREIARSDDATTTVLAEKIIIIDLEGDSSLFSSGMEFLQAAPTVGACFPETNNRTYILNARFSFSIVWAVIRRMMDPRSVQKIGFFSTISKAKKDFAEHIDSDQLLSSYGGTGQSFDDILAARQREAAHKKGVVRYVVELLAMSGRQIGFDFDVTSDERVDSIVIYSRSDNKCEISVVDGKCNYIVDYRDVSRKQATSKSKFRDDAPDQSNSHNNYAVEIATSKNFTADTTGPFFVNTKSGVKGDYFLVAISIAEKKVNSSGMGSS